MKEESLLLLSDLQKLINQVVLIDYTIIILGGRNMYANLDKQLKRNNYLPYISKKNDEVQMIISHEITVQLGREMRKMSRTLSRTILEGLDIEHRK